MDTHKLLSGETLKLLNLGAEEKEFLRGLASDAEKGADYFDLLRRVKGPKAVLLRGGPITVAIAASAAYRVAHDIADRVGIKQGYLLAPDVAGSAQEKVGGELLSLTEAADLIGITRPAAHQALREERLRGRQVGNAWVIARADAETFKQARGVRSRAEGVAETSRRTSANSRR